MKEFFNKLLSSSGEVSSKRVIALTSVLLFDFILLVDLFTERFTINDNVFDAFTVITLSSMGTIVGDNIIQWKYGAKIAEIKALTELEQEKDEKIIQP